MSVFLLPKDLCARLTSAIAEFWWSSGDKKRKIPWEDSYCWGFTNHGSYSTQSGYRLTEAILTMNNSENQSLPPVEKKLWGDLWKVKAPPKLKHFLWRALSGALAVKERLRTRGIAVDITCQGCGQASETICHVLFCCDKARRVWDLANIPLPPAGFSRSSVLLNLVHLLSVSKNRGVDVSIQRVFPWMLWQYWKARNSVIFNKLHADPHHTVSHAYEEAELWYQAQTGLIEAEPHHVKMSWHKPPEGSIKCNISSSWINASQSCGVSWILRDSRGSTILHSRRAYSYVHSKEEADLYALL
ncbi:hypothetical protein Bca52824_023695 [Brassica carinata]|uniref:Reverse transcriptase zinc-binding domain-containing protein n=1 Tax=Brassica carinata TaxID=52824 RepID=A0A8X7VI99_BRACI|nr:hypothetical protein Bca52824_023695 [Brassica carinata]